MNTTTEPLSLSHKRKKSAEIRLLEKLVRMLGTQVCACSVNDLVAYYKAPSSQITVLKFMAGQIERLKSQQCFGTASNYQRAYNSLAAFLKSSSENIDIPFLMMNEDFVIRYSNWLEGRNILRNSISFYMRIWRAVYNKAVKERLVEQSFPFENVYTGIDHTCKRAVGEKIILDLLNLDLSNKPALMLSRDLFVFSYCTRGMAFVDIAFLRKNNISNGVISYYRQKTGQRLQVRVETCVQMLIERYAEQTQGSPYVFPLLDSEENEVAYRQYQSALGCHNRRLKELGEMLGVALPLSSYTPRHTWATAARNHNVPVSVISACMGHTSEKTTMIYLASLENSVMDQANSELVRDINRCVSF